MRYIALAATLFYALCGHALAQSYPTPQFNQLVPNFSLSSSVTSHELTVSLLDPNGNALGSSHPVIIDYPAPSTGANVFRPISASLSITTGATSDSFGCVTAVICKIWVWAIDNSGTEGICLYNTVSGTSIIDLNESVAQTSASGTGGGASAQTLYCNISSVTSKIVRRLGYIEAIWTSGTGWASATTVQLFGPGIKKPGDVVQTFPQAQDSSSFQNGTGTFTITTLTQTVTLTSAANLVEATAQVNVTSGTNGTLFVELGRTSNSNLFGTIAGFGSAGATNSVMPVSGYDRPGTTSSTTYGIYIKGNGNASYNGFSGGGITSTMELMEISS